MSRKVKANKQERIEYNVKRDFSTGAIIDFCTVIPQDIRIVKKSNRKLKSGKHFSNKVKGELL